MFSDKFKSELYSRGISRLSPIFNEDAFSRDDSSDDKIFYEKDRFVNHIDKVAINTVEQLIGDLVIEKNPVILDLMAGWDSHIPESLNTSEVIGLGLNENELKKNKSLTGYLLHDLNADTKLPFNDNYFDLVINSLSVDYMIKPLEVFQEAGRVLKPGGLYLVIFSNRMFPRKAVKVWKDSSESERIILVEEFFQGSGIFEKPVKFVSKGKDRPEDDKYYEYCRLSDPVYALYAEKKGGKPDRAKRPMPVPDIDEDKKRELERKKKEIKETLCCPHCGDKLQKWLVPDNPFVCTWDNDFMYICFNDECSYYTRGWDFLRREGNSGSYRLMYNPEKDVCMPVPVPNAKALREGIAVDNLEEVKTRC
jgi:SAM-dependent methyltransferase